MEHERAMLHSWHRRSSSPVPLHDADDADPRHMEDSGRRNTIPTSQPNFHFVHVSGNSRNADRRDPSTRKAIQRHVMHDFVRRKQQDSFLRTKTSSPPTHKRSFGLDAIRFKRVSPRRSPAGFGRSRSVSSQSSSDASMESITKDVARWTPPPTHHSSLTGLELKKGELSYCATSHNAKPAIQQSIFVNDRESSVNEQEPFSLSLSPGTLLDSANPDPFLTSDVFMTPKMQRYVHLYLKSIIPNAVRPQHPTDIMDIGRLGINSKAVLYSSIAVAAVYDHYESGNLIAFLENQQTQSVLLSELFIFKSKAIEAINEAMTDMTQGISDSTIGAILNICGLETMLGNSKQLLVHLQGLQQIIKLRGGLHSLPQLLQNGVSIVDVLTCHFFDNVLLFEAPALPYKRPSDLIAQTLTSEYPGLRRQASTLLELSCFMAIHPTLVDVWRDLRNLTNFSAWCKMYPQSVTADQVRYFRVKHNHVEHSLIQLGNEQGIPVLPQTPFQESCRLATRLFVNSVLFKCSPSNPRTRLLIANLKSSLEASMHLPVKIAAHGRAIFWILAMGSLCSAEQVERPWFALHLAKVGKALDVRDWDAAKEVLLGCFYLEDSASDLLQRSWAEARLIGDVVGG